MFRLKDFQISRPALASGAFGQVFRGRQLSTSLDVAIKKVALQSEESKQEYEHELKVNCCQVLFRLF